MVPHVGLTGLLERLSSNSDLEECLATAALAISFILASLFDLSFRIVSTTVLVLTLPSTRLIVSHIVCAVRHLLSVRSLVLDVHLVVPSSSLSQAVTRHLVNAIPILLLMILITLATWSTLSGFYPCDVADSTTPSTPRGPQGRSPMSFRHARGIPVLKLPPDQTPTPCRKREHWHLEIIEAHDARISRRAKRLEKLTLRLDRAREAVAARDATIADREQTISENVAALAERDRTIVEGIRAIAAKDAIIACLTKDAYGEHLWSDNSDVLSMLTDKAAHISDLYHRLDTAGEAEERREASGNALHSKVALETDLNAARAEAARLSIVFSEKTTVPLESTISSREASDVSHKDELIASLPGEVLKLQRELDLLHCRIVEKDALLAIQAATIGDLWYEHDADISSIETQTQLVEHSTSMGITYGQEEANLSLAEHHLPPASPDGLETCTVTADIDICSLTDQLDAARQEALDAKRLQKAYEEVADAGAVRVIELVQQLEEQKELSEVDRELFLVRIRKLTALLDKARSGIPVPDKAFAQLRLPANTRSARTEDVFTTVTPRLPASTQFPSPSPSLDVLPNERKLRRRSVIENLRQPLTDLTTCATANAAPLGGQPAPRSRLPRPSSLPSPGMVTRSPLATKISIPAS